MNRTLYQWQDDSGWQRGRLVVDEKGYAPFQTHSDQRQTHEDFIEKWVRCRPPGTESREVLIEPIHRTQFQPMVWVPVSKLQVAPTGEERNG